VGSTVLKTVAWLAFAFTLGYAALALLGGGASEALGCAVFGVPFWLIALKFADNLSKQEKVEEALAIERARRLE
jgi:hypothetical protein